MNTSGAVLLPSAYFPPAAWMAAFFTFEEVWIEQWEHYQKGGMRNRCFIATAQGAQRLTIPLLKGKHQQLPIREVRIDYRESWVKKHWHSLETAYRKAPFFDEYAAQLWPVFQRQPAFLFDLNLELLHLLLKLLRIRNPLPQMNGQYEKNPAWGVDLRHVFRPEYPAGQMMPGFRIVPYPQVFQDRNGFLPNLSILDMLFCLGPDTGRYLESGIKGD